MLPRTQNQSLARKVTDREAKSCKDRLEENLRFVERGLLEVPTDAELGVFLLSGGKLNAKPVIEQALTLGDFFASYQGKHPEGAKEASTRYTEDIHIRHLLRIIGPAVSVRSITTAMMQNYVDQRSLESSKFKRPISHITVKKEIGTRASLWNKWSLPQRLVTGPAPTKGLIYRKTKSKPPFQTWEQVERQIARGGLTETERKELWNSLFLTLPQIHELLAFMRGKAHRPYAYIMFSYAAFTGARRSEMLRSRVEDFDFEANTVTIREKKKDRSKDMTFRTVPLCPAFREIVREWLAGHPGGQHTICGPTGKQISVQMAAKAFRRNVKTTKWQVLRGWHVQWGHGL